MAALIEILTSSVSYDSSWAVYAKTVNGKFTPENPARFGQRCFENGGMLDGFEFFDNNESIRDSRQIYCGSEGGSSSFYEEWAEMYIGEVNSL